MHASTTDSDAATRQRLIRAVVPANDATITGTTLPMWARPPCSTQVRRAQPSASHAIAVLVAVALHPLALSAWLVPDPHRRRQVLTDVAAIHVEHTLTEGQAWTIPDSAVDIAAAALWLPYDEGEPNRPDDYEQHLAEACGPAIDRFRPFDQMSARHYTPEPHHQHLTVLAAHPHRQRQGLGRHVLLHQHTILDAAGVPACVTAADAASRTWYRGLGYADVGPPIDLPDGPRLWPMWRQR